MADNGSYQYNSFKERYLMNHKTNDEKIVMRSTPGRNCSP